MEQSNTRKVAFVVDKETDNNFRLVPEDKSGDVTGSLYVRKGSMPEGTSRAVVTVVLE